VTPTERQRQNYERSVLSLPLQSRTAQMHLGYGKSDLEICPKLQPRWILMLQANIVRTTIHKQESDWEQPVAKLLRSPTSTRLLIFLLIFPRVSYIETLHFSIQRKLQTLGGWMSIASCPVPSTPPINGISTTINSSQQLRMTCGAALRITDYLCYLAHMQG